MRQTAMSIALTGSCFETSSGYFMPNGVVVARLVLFRISGIFLRLDFASSSNRFLSASFLIIVRRLLAASIITGRPDAVTGA